MKTRPHIPLLAKVFGWLFLHLLILASVFMGFMGWQLKLGLDSLLSGAAGDRLRDFGDSARSQITGLPRSEWTARLQPLGVAKRVVTAVFNPAAPADFPTTMPPNVLERARTSLPPPGPRGRREPPPPSMRMPSDDDLDFPDDRNPPPFDDPDNPPPRDPPRDMMQGPPPAPDGSPPAHPVFLMRGKNGDGYWAGIQLTMPGPPHQPRRQELLLVRATSLDGSGMFFEFKPWLWGGAAVLALSLAFWAPFVWNITGYVRRLTDAADRIAAGHFRVSLPARGNDELGNLGSAIEVMAARLDHLVSGQKRFLGDAAHELCAPLARLRTGLGILEMKLPDSDQPYLARIESEAHELATLVEEILAFSRAGNRAPRNEMIILEPLVREIAAREAGTVKPLIQVPADLTAFADPALLGRALANLVRNSRLHGGTGVTISIAAADEGEWISIHVADDGPGVPAEELSRLFEPFYRTDRSRSRETGGNGLGLAIVRAAINACGGEVTASLPPAGGFSVTLRLRKSPLLSSN